MEAVLSDPAIGNFRCERLTNPDFAAASSKVAEFFDAKQPDDLLVLYFSGHGLLDDWHEPYLAIKNTLTARPWGAGLAGSLLNLAMNRCPCKYQVLILDCCYYAGARKGRIEYLKKGAQAAAAYFQDDRNRRFVLGAAAREAFAHDDAIGESPNSVFTHLLLEGLRTGAADLDGDGVIGLDNLYHYLRKRAKDLNLRQGPPIKSGNLEIDEHSKIEFARNPVPLSRLSDELRKLLQSDRVPDLLKAVAELDRALADGGDARADEQAFRELRRLARHAHDVVRGAAMPSLSRHEAARRVHTQSRKIPVAVLAGSFFVVVLILAMVFATGRWSGLPPGRYFRWFVPKGSHLTEGMFLIKAGERSPTADDPPFEGYCNAHWAWPGTAWNTEHLDLCPERQPGLYFRRTVSKGQVLTEDFVKKVETNQHPSDLRFEDIKGLCVVSSYRPGDRVTYDRVGLCN
jgi:hypothetical protein